MEDFDRIRNMLDRPIAIFIKGTPERPMCAGSERLVQALDAVGADYHSINLQEDPVIRAYLSKFSDFPTFPQLFMQGQFIGGAEVAQDLLEAGELTRMVDACRAPSVANA